MSQVDGSPVAAEPRGGEAADSVEVRRGSDPARFPACSPQGWTGQAPTLPPMVTGAMPCDDTDARSLARMAAGDASALAALYDRYGRRTFAMAYRITGSPDTAEEVVQDAFLALWRRADLFTPGLGDVRSWLLTIVRNRAIDHLRARRSRPQRAATVEDVSTWLSAPDDTSATVLQVLEASVVRAAVATLPPPQRQAVELAYFAGLSYPEVAAATGAPLATVKSRLRLALAKLREALAQPPVAG